MHIIIYRQQLKKIMVTFNGNELLGGKGPPTNSKTIIYREGGMDGWMTVISLSQ